LTTDLETINGDGGSICSAAYRIDDQAGVTRIQTCADMLERIKALHNFGPFQVFQIVWDLSFSQDGKRTSPPFSLFLVCFLKQM